MNGRRAGLRYRRGETVSGQGKCDKPRDAKLSGDVSVQEAPFYLVWQLSAYDEAHDSLKKNRLFASSQYNKRPRRGVAGTGRAENAPAKFAGPRILRTTLVW